MNDYERQSNHRTMIFQENERLLQGPVPRSIQHQVNTLLSSAIQATPKVKYFQEYTNDTIMQ